MTTDNEIAITISLTEEEWAEVMNALRSKADLIENGDYGEEDEELEFYPDRWEQTLRDIYAKLEPILTQHEITY